MIQILLRILECQLILGNIFILAFWRFHPWSISYKLEGKTTVPSRKEQQRVVTKHISDNDEIIDAGTSGQIDIVKK